MCLAKKNAVSSGVISVDPSEWLEVSQSKKQKCYLIEAVDLMSECQELIQLILNHK